MIISALNSRRDVDRLTGMAIGRSSEVADRRRAAHAFPMGNQNVAHSVSPAAFACGTPVSHQHRPECCPIIPTRLTFWELEHKFGKIQTVNAITHHQFLGFDKPRVFWSIIGEKWAEVVPIVKERPTLGRRHHPRRTETGRHTDWEFW